MHEISESNMRRHQWRTKAAQDRDTNAYLSKTMVSAVSIGAHWGSPHWTSVTLIWQAGRSMSSGTNFSCNCSSREHSALMAAASLTALLLGMNMVHEKCALRSVRVLSSVFRGLLEYSIEDYSVHELFKSGIVRP
jgi:hypothetical protein